MIRKIVVFTVSSLILFNYFCFSSQSDPVEIFVNASDIYMDPDEWVEEGVISCEIEGVNITIRDELTKVQMVFREIMGRDVLLNFVSPSESIPSNFIDFIKTDVDIEVFTFENMTLIRFKIIAFQMVTIDISKSSMLKSEMKKNIHNWFNYVEYNTDVDRVEPEVIVSIDKYKQGFEVDRDIIVQVKTDFYDWYYPVSNKSSNDFYYEIQDLGTRYKATVYFKDNCSGDVKIFCFPQGSGDKWSWDSIKAAAARSWINIELFVKKVVIDLFDGPNPRF